MFLKQIISYIFLAVLFLAPTVPVFAVAPYEIVTYSATNACQSGATLNGYVNPFFSNDTTRWFEWGASEGSLSNQTVATRNGSNTEYFEQDIYNLVPNTTYYFRAVAQNSKGLARGSVFGFKTAGNVPCATPVSIPTSSVNTTSSGNTNTYVSQSVTTKPATNIIDTGAIVNAVALTTGSVQTYGWFEWGSTPDLGYTSIRRYLGVGATLPLSESLSGLTPGTTYFFKPILENQNGRFEGALFSFHTTGMTPVVAVVPNTSNNSNTATLAIKKSPQSQIAAVVAAVNNPKPIKVEVTPSAGTAAPKERISETVQFENTTGATLKETAVRVIIPCDAEYVSAGGDTKNSDWLQTGSMLTHKVGEVKPGEKVSLLFWMDVAPDTTDKAPLETIAVVDWQDKIHPKDTQSVGRAAVVVDVHKSATGSVVAVGAVKSTNSIFPQNLKDWGAVIGVLFLLFAAYMVFLVMRRKDLLSDEDVAQEEAPAFQGAAVVYSSLGGTRIPQKDSGSDPFITSKSTQKNETIIPVVPVKKIVTEKGAPPENLPI